MPAAAGEDDEKEAAWKLFQSAYALQMRGQLADAIATYRSSIAHHPTAEAHTFLGWTYSIIGLHEDAIAECHKAIALDPAFGNPYNDIGAYLIELERWDEAIPWFEKAMVAPRYEARAYPHMNLGRVYQHKGEWTKALQCFRQALALQANYRPARDAFYAVLGKLN
jgi:Tfp pilus assembly protein PilF